MLGRSSGNHDWLLANASACVSCGFRLRNARSLQAIAFEWKPGFTLTKISAKQFLRALPFDGEQRLSIDSNSVNN